MERSVIVYGTEYMGSNRNYPASEEFRFGTIFLFLLRNEQAVPRAPNLNGLRHHFPANKVSLTKGVHGKMVSEPV